MQTRTRRQKQVLDFIEQYIEKHGYEPSYQQIAWHLGVRSKAGVAKHIAALEKLGLLSRRKENGSFCIELNKSQSLSEAVCEIEWLADEEHYTEFEEWQKTPLIVPKFFVGYFTPENLCAFTVKSDAMSEDNIYEGDIALLEKRSFARDGDIVAAHVRKKPILLKRFYRAGADIELRPSNVSFSNLKFPADQVVVKGIFRGILRPLA